LIPRSTPFRSRPELQGVKTRSLQALRAPVCSEADPNFRGSKRQYPNSLKAL